MHEKRRDHACPHCKGVAFGEKSTLKKHIKIVHEKRKDHACLYCKGVAFGERSTLKTHIKTVHEKRAGTTRAS